MDKTEYDKITTNSSSQLNNLRGDQGFQHFLWQFTIETQYIRGYFLQHPRPYTLLTSLPGRTAYLQAMQLATTPQHYQQGPEAFHRLKHGPN